METNKGIVNYNVYIILAYNQSKTTFNLECRINKVYISSAAHTHSNQTYFSGCSIVDKFYGADCCPDVNCLKCHMENGTCVECDPGFQGDRCEQGDVRC